MAALGKGVFCFGLRYASTLMSVGGALVGRQVAKFPTTIRKNWISLTATGGLCAVPFAQKQDSLSHEALIRRAASLVTDSTNTFLSQTTLALVDSFTHYVKAVHTLVTLQKNYAASASKLAPEDEEAVWQAILRQRQELSVLREDCNKFESNWTTAVSLSELAAETAYSAGADQACVMSRSSLHVAQSHVEQVRQRCLGAEESLKESNAEDSGRLPPATATEEEEDIPEAYLRED